MTNSLEPAAFSPEPTPRASWRWRLLDSFGQEVDSVTAGQPSFPSQGDAESWVGEVWRDLLEDGVESVVLLEGEREVYGPMSLRA